MLGATAGDDWLDPTCPQFTAIFVVVIAAIGDHAIGTLTGAADFAAHRADAVHERQQLGDVVAVAARERDRKRDARRVDDQMVLFDPVRPWSTGEGPVKAPLKSTYMAAVHHRSRPVDRPSSVQPLDQQRV